MVNPYESPKSYQEQQRHPVSSHLRVRYTVGFVVIAIVGWSIHAFVLPWNITSSTAIVMRLVYLLGLLFLLDLYAASIAFGRRCRGFHIVAHLIGGAAIGFIAGLFYAGVLGAVIGVFAGPTLGLLVFVWRLSTLPRVGVD